MTSAVVFEGAAATEARPWSLLFFLSGGTDILVCGLQCFSVSSKLNEQVREGQALHSPTHPQTGMSVPPNTGDRKDRRRETGDTCAASGDEYIPAPPHIYRQECRCHLCLRPLTRLLARLLL